MPVICSHSSSPDAGDAAVMPRYQATERGWISIGHVASVPFSVKFMELLMGSHFRTLTVLDFGRGWTAKAKSALKDSNQTAQ